MHLLISVAMFDVGPCLETSLVFDEACHLGFLLIAQPPLYSTLLHTKETVG